MKAMIKGAAKKLPGLRKLVRERDQLREEMQRLKAERERLRVERDQIRAERDGLKTASWVTSEFHRLYYRSGVWGKTYWLGVRALKCPLDLWVYQEIIQEQRPDVIIECGTRYGGSALFFASVCELVGKGRVVSIDVEALEGRPWHERIEYVLGSSVSEEVVGRMRERVGEQERVMVILDSDHHEEHVAEELRLYSELVTVGSYVIVEDTNVNGNPVYEDFGPGPMEAVQEFLKDNECFAVDREREKFRMTFNPSGYLRRIR